MRLTFVQLRTFLVDVRDLGLRDEDLRVLELALLLQPDAGRVMAGTGGLRKMRFAPPSWGRGKSGATRICYAWFADVQAIYFFTIYTKQEKDNLSAADRNYYRKVLESYHRWIRENPGALP